MKKYVSITAVILMLFLTGCTRFKVLTNNTASYSNGKIAKAYAIQVKDFQNDNLTWSEIEQHSADRYTPEVDTLYIYYFQEDLVGSTIQGLMLKRSYRKKCIAIYKQIPEKKGRMIKFPFEESRMSK